MSNWKDAYEHQMELWRWVRSDFAMRWRAEHFEYNAEGLSANSRGLLAECYALEENKLLTADPFYVSREMCELVDAARKTFKPEPILPTDFLSQCGFMYLARPIIIPDKFNAEVGLTGFSWSPIYAVDGPAVENPEDIIDSWWNSQEEGRQGGVAMTLYVTTKTEFWQHGKWPPPPSMIPNHHTPWWFGMTFDGNEVDERGEPTAALEWWRVAQATLRLSQQRLSHRSTGTPDRSTRRRAARLGFREREVVVVRLRRERADDRNGDGEHGEANYSHRFIVSGHWRDQWYPSAQTHRQIWISPYVKGPEDQPLVVRPKRVYTWNR